MNEAYADALPISTWPAGWRYRPAPAAGLVEIATLRGASAGLATHFHDETQITFVAAGQRRMTIAGRAIEIEAGRCACIPAGMPHGDSAQPSGVAGFIAYVPAGEYDLPGLARDVEAFWNRRYEMPWAALAEMAERRRHLEAAAAPPGPTDLPASSSMSREGFSRLFRRRVGMPPHAFEVAGRLNEARRRLRAGEPVAAVAAATGFADQSHLGRLFRRAYGVTPGVYGRGHRTITNVPDA